MDHEQQPDKTVLYQPSEVTSPGGSAPPLVPSVNSPPGTQPPSYQDASNS